MDSLKKRVRNALKRSGWTQKKLARKSSVSEPTITGILRGSQPRYDTFRKVERTLLEIENDAAAS